MYYDYTHPQTEQFDDLDHHLYAILGSFGVPLYDLEFAFAVNHKLPLSEELLVKKIEADDDLSERFANLRAHSLLTGAYLGVFTTNNLGLLPPDFAAEPYDKTNEISFVQDVLKSQPNKGLGLHDTPYPLGVLTPRNLLRDDFKPLRIVIRPLETSI